MRVNMASLRNGLDGPSSSSGRRVCHIDPRAFPRRTCRAPSAVPRDRVRPLPRDDAAADPRRCSVHERAGAAVLGRDLRHGSRLPVAALVAAFSSSPPRRSSLDSSSASSPPWFRGRCSPATCAIGPWTMVIAGSASPACWSLVYDAPAPTSWRCSRRGVAGPAVSRSRPRSRPRRRADRHPACLRPLGDWDEDGEAFVYCDGRTDRGASDASCAGNAGSWRR